MATKLANYVKLIIHFQVQEVPSQRQNFSHYWSKVKIFWRHMITLYDDKIEFYAFIHTIY